MDENKTQNKNEIQEESAHCEHIDIDIYMELTTFNYILSDYLHLLAWKMKKTSPLRS